MNDRPVEVEAAELTGLLTPPNLVSRLVTASVALLMAFMFSIVSPESASFAQERSAMQAKSQSQKSISQKSNTSKPTGQLTLTQQKSVSSPLPQGSLQNQKSAEIVDEIKAIRSQLGGGVAGQLEGLFQDPAEGKELEGEFEKELMRKLEAMRKLGGPTEGEAGAKEAINPDDAQGPLAASGSGVAAKRLLRSLKSVSPTGASPVNISPNRTGGFSGAVSNGQVASLRNAARHLEAAAADLEETGLYSEADHLREQARSLWRRGRGNSLVNGSAHR